MYMPLIKSSISLKLLPATAARCSCLGQLQPVLAARCKKPVILSQKVAGSTPVPARIFLEKNHLKSAGTSSHPGSFYIAQVAVV